MIRRHPAPSAGATTQATAAGSTGRGTRATGLRRRVAEASGKVAADCAALCCCCPCSVMNLVVLAVYRVPAGLCRQVAGKRRRGVTGRRRRGGGGNGGGVGNGQERPSEGDVDAEDSVVELLRKAREGGGGGAGGAAAEESLEREMWERFSRTGFWRSPSAKDS